MRDDRDGVHVVERRLVARRVALDRQDHAPVAVDGGLERCDRARPAGRERRQLRREDDVVPQRDRRQASAMPGRGRRLGAGSAGAGGSTSGIETSIAGPSGVKRRSRAPSPSRAARRRRSTRRRAAVLDAERRLPVAAEARRAPVRGRDQSDGVGDHALGVARGGARRIHAPDLERQRARRRAASHASGTASEQQRALDARDRRAVLHEVEQAANRRRRGMRVRNGHQDAASGARSPSSASAAPTAAPPIDEHAAAATRRSALIGATCGVGVPTSGARASGAAATSVPEAASRSPSAHRTPRRAARCRALRCRRASTHHSRVPGERRRESGGKRRCRSRGASRQMRFPVPDRDGRRRRSAACRARRRPRRRRRGIRRPRRDSSRAVAALPSDTCASSDEPHAHAATRRTDQLPSI